MAVIDLESHGLATIPARDGLNARPPLLPLVASLDTGGDLVPMPPRAEPKPDDHIVLTFDGLVRDEHFINLMRAVLDRLQTVYERPVNLEFAINLEANDSPAEEGTPEGYCYHLYILECRPLHERNVPAPQPHAGRVKDKRRLFTTPTLLPAESIGQLEYLVFVDPKPYYHLVDDAARYRVADTVTALNDLLPAGRFALMGPGRWGSLDSRRSVPVTYSDICNSKLLVEISPPYTPAPELAYGTDFYEDVVESNILVLGIQPAADSDEIDWELLRQSPNLLERYVPAAADLAGYIRVIDLRAAGGSPLQIIIDDETKEAVACFEA